MTSFAIGTHQQQHPQNTTGMMTTTNAEGLYATAAIEEGTVVVTEGDMPDCELHRSSANPNCSVVELENGTNAVVARRNIAVGEFFCVPESDDESGFYEEEEYEEDDEEVDDMSL